MKVSTVFHVQVLILLFFVLFPCEKPHALVVTCKLYTTLNFEVNRL